MSNILDRVSATGTLKIVLTGPDGQLKQQQEVQNLVVTTGLGFIAARMKDATATAMSHMAVGSGTTAPGAAQTALVNELGRVALTSTTVTDNAVAYVATFGAGTGTGAVTEAGLFNGSETGTMLCRTKFDVVNKGAADTLSVTWTVTIGVPA